ncbi:hypothetical protein llap_19901 [Limosa lapponica baueri]|uniref:Uncharacterized protein n=1 Tax=Limosa lapponica baueri TaxID=1758121 RepID=A0A2I0T7L1_LIMLA|nr:hypothetical protein llap_19901 [Limosa lapponica baueri]
MVTVLLINDTVSQYHPTQTFSAVAKRYGLLVYPEYLPDSPNRPVQFNNFTAWSSQGGAQIFRSSNLEIQHFWIYACKDFGIDIVESLGNTSVSDSVLIGHTGQKDRWKDSDVVLVKRFRGAQLCLVSCSTPGG